MPEGRYEAEVGGREEEGESCGARDGCRNRGVEEDGLREEEGEEREGFEGR